MTIAVVAAAKNFKGEIYAPPSKSYIHRAIIASSLARGSSYIKLLLYADDIIATINACSLFGVSIKQDKKGLRIFGSPVLIAPSQDVFCRDSASTIRFLTPIAALAKGKTILDGNMALRNRPIDPLIKALEKLGVQCSSNNGYPPVTVVGGNLRGGRTSLVGDVSSQFVSGLLFACPLAEDDTEITLTTPLESKPYVKLTIEILKYHGIKIVASRGLRKFIISGKQRYLPREHIVPGDYSSAAFLLAAAAMTNSDITVKHLFPNQPDEKIIEILSKMGVAINVTDSSVRVIGSKLKGITIDAKDIPDLVPVCVALACVAEGTTRIFGAKRLRIKESDRLNTLYSTFQRMGADIVETSEGLTINGPNSLQGATVDPNNDHRIAMACSIAGLTASGKTKILNAECVNKSYPTFFKDLMKLGAKISVK